MAKRNQYPMTPDRNESSLLSAWSRSRVPLYPPGLPPPRRTVEPASPPPYTSTSTHRPRRPTVEPTLPRNVPTQPAAMRRAQEAQQAKQQNPTPRKRVVPNILPNQCDEPRTPTRPFKPNPPPSPPASVPPPPPPPPPSPLLAPRPQRITQPPSICNPSATQDAINAAALAKSRRTTKSRCINANIYGYTPTGAPVITHTELIDYPTTQQQADYAALLADSTPEQTWESNRKATMVPPARTWLESDLFALQWYNAVILNYNQKIAASDQLGAAPDEKEIEKRLKSGGRVSGGMVTVEQEIQRARFQEDLMMRTRDMVMRDNGVMPRNAIGRPAAVGDPVQAWADGFERVGSRMDALGVRGRVAAEQGLVFFAEQKKDGEGVASE